MKKIKPWIKDVSRIEPQPVSSTKLRLHSCERLRPFDVHLPDLLTDDDFLYYQTTTSLKQKLADHHGVDISNIFLAPGSDAVIKTFTELFVHGTEVWTTHYHFPMYGVYSVLSGLSFNVCNNETLQGKDIAIVSNPNSPLGTLLNHTDLHAIISANEYVLVDEAYIDYVSEDVSAIPLIDQYRNLVVVKSFSKGFGGAGCRVGYAVASAEIIESMSKFRPIFELSGQALKYASYILDNYDHAMEYCKGTEQALPKIKDLFASKGYRVFGDYGNWMHIEETSELVEYLSEYATLRIGCKYHMYPDVTWIRLTISDNLLDYDFMHHIPFNSSR